MKNIITIVLDSFGIGNAPDSHLYGDCGSNTYKAISKGIKLPNLVKMGLNNIDGVDSLPKCDNPIASYGRLFEKSAGKDTITGHYEMMGVITERAYPTYPKGFPPDVVSKLEQAFCCKVLGNKPASGTVIIEELGDEHMASGCPIIYTSADSVLQIACSEDIYSIEEIYKMCLNARDIMSGEHAVARVIARPFICRNGKYIRTDNRKDYSLKCPYNNLLQYLQEKSVLTVGIGKITDIFGGEGIDKIISAHTNEEVMQSIVEQMETCNNAFIFANLVDFDMKYGHRNDIKGYAKAMEEFDRALLDIISVMKEKDILIITADHGCDPSTVSSDHSRESVPIIIYGEKVLASNLGSMTGFDNIAGFIAKIAKVEEKYPQDIANAIVITE